MSLGFFHTPDCLASPSPRVDDLFQSQLLADVATSDTAAPVPPAALSSAGGAQTRLHTSLLPVGTKNI